ncbi:stage III sporulation protein AF [Desulfotomaculum arcticum]|uniref:Stage III sporulation protein AF n=1 Tax=Desulfotruncus arcticus DSM 17038 TaxID=1121424 RepID=A0A1I2MPB8_9FIRM|nr:stage III sporulation protein AF [Desulfotruncus arcticus]SFF93405.1 stage III sporulation protein AF [Desulfotomaculum arcticum] [Desulfotruncus arcticus DSM 17038]
MDMIRELIKTIVIIVLLAVFIEMILPKGDMRRYVKMVMGLLVILAVVQTAAGALNLSLMQEVPQLKVGEGGGAPPLDDIIATGKKLSELNQDEAVEQYKQGIASQVLSMARLNPTVSAREALVQLGGEMNDVNEITIIFGPAADRTEEQARGEKGINVAPVEIGAIGNNIDTQLAKDQVKVSPEEKKAAGEVVRAVAQFYNLQPDQVRFEFR